MGIENTCCCGNPEWDVHYQGAVRNGDFGKVIDNAQVLKCRICGIVRLEERHCLTEADYEGEAYRTALGQTHDPKAQLELHKPRLEHQISMLSPIEHKGRLVADIGAAYGGLLDELKTEASDCIAIEPNEIFRNSLIERGYKAFAFTDDAIKAHGNSVDLALSCEVIEHVEDPKQFLMDIENLLKPGGEVMIITRNINDVLLNLAPDVFSSFFFCTQHRWYFSIDTLGELAEQCGLNVNACYTSHIYGISNALNWLRHHRPKGHERLDGIDDAIDAIWRNWCAGKGMGDSLILKARKA